METCTDCGSLSPEVENGPSECPRCLNPDDNDGLCDACKEVTDL